MKKRVEFTMPPSSVIWQMTAFTSNPSGKKSSGSVGSSLIPNGQSGAKKHEMNMTIDKIKGL